MRKSRELLESDFKQQVVILNAVKTGHISGPFYLCNLQFLIIYKSQQNSQSLVAERSSMFRLSKVYTRTNISLSKNINGGSRMELNSVWKNVLLLTLGSVFALHLNLASAQDDSTSIKTNDDEEGCVITDDQYSGIKYNLMSGLGRDQ